MSAGDLRGLFLEALGRALPRGPTARAVEELTPPGGWPEVVLLATGKASLAMAAGAEAALGDRCVARVVVAPRLGDAAGRPGYLEAAHPVPDARSQAAGRALLDAARAARPDQAVLALISGGGSSLSAVPADGLTLADKAAALALVAASGASIAELNCVRRHLSAIKGGRLALASAAPVTTLVVSDVIGDALREVASGPTVVDTTRFEDACQVVEQRVGWDALPAAVRQHLEEGRAGRRPEGLVSPRAGDRARLVLGFEALADAAAQAAAARGLSVVRLPGPIEGEVETAADLVAGWILDSGARSDGGAAPGPGWVAVAGAEATVTLPERPGRGGRAQQMALLLARHLRGQPGVTALVAGSDGVDGNSDAAGAVVDGTTWDAIAAAGLDPSGHLARCDAAPALAAVGAQIVTGPTGVNHADLVLLSGPGTPSRGASRSSI